MKNKIIVAFAVIFSAIVFNFSSNTEKAEGFALESENGKCAILPFQAAFNGSAAVFSGEVVSEKKEGDTKIFDFKVEKYWKGTGKKKIKIHVYETARFQAWFDEGKKYLVYAEADDDGNLHVRRCSRSKNLEDAADDLGKLGTGKNPK